MASIEGPVAAVRITCLALLACRYPVRKISNGGHCPTGEIHTAVPVVLEAIDANQDD